MASPAPDQPAAAADRPQAVLLVGPTAAGKTPLGDALQAGGLWGRACRHFDFGRVVRACVVGGGEWGLAPGQCALLASLLRTGALLEDEHWPMAERLFGAFLARLQPPPRGGLPRPPRAQEPRRPGKAAARPPVGDPLIVLNGLPRHTGQAERMDRLVRMRAVVHLACPDEAVRARIRRDPGGDRAERDDDDPARLRRKLAVYRERTEPLLAHYAACGVPVILVDVDAAATPDAMRAELERRGPP